MEVNINEVLALLGIKEVALNQAHAQLAQQAERIKALEGAAESKKVAEKQPAGQPA